MHLAQLAAAAVVPVVVIFDFEGGFVKPPKSEDLAAIQAALEQAGVEFTKGGVRERDGST
jgi:hypothetical protein